jgi:hypothetical protein
MRRAGPQILILSCLISSCLALMATGCTLGYRYHNLDSKITNATGANAQIEGSGHTVELGIVLDFRYFRLVSPYLGSSYEMDIADSRGGGDHQTSTEEVRGVRLDVPLVSLVSEGGGVGYPGTMVHRKGSLELWGSITARPSELPLWYADLGVVYYHYNLVAVRAFGGWGAVPYEGQTSRMGRNNVEYEFWEATPNGYTGGIELTVGAGEQALDFLKWFGDSQEAAGKPPR